MPETQIDTADLFRLLKERDITIAKLSRGAKVPDSNIRSWKDRGTTPNKDDWQKVLNYLADLGIFKKEKPATVNESMITVLVDRIAELLAAKNGTSTTIEAHKIFADAETLRKLTEGKSSS